jgi:uncharacterized protein YbjQ (UPF0145 family)
MYFIGTLLIVWGLPLLLAYVVGRTLETRHFRSIEQREQATLAFPITANKVPVGRAPVDRTELVTGSAVISIDYFKRALARLRNIVGGPIKSYEPLLDRARREAVLRLKANCPGAHEVINLRLETCAISGKANGEVSAVEVVAYGTAIYFTHDPQDA